MSSSANQKNLSIIHKSTFDRLSEVERYFVERWVTQGRYRVIPDEVPEK